VLRLPASESARDGTVDRVDQLIVESLAGARLTLLDGADERALRLAVALGARPGEGRWRRGAFPDAGDGRRDGASRVWMEADAPAVARRSGNQVPVDQVKLFRYD
jgi:hypothetical protein